MPQDNEEKALVYGPPAIRQGRKKKLEKLEVDFSDYKNQINSLVDQISKKSSDNYQYSAAFDYYRQTSTTGPNSNVLEQLYGRNLSFLRQYYHVNSPIDKIIFGKRNEQMRILSDCVADVPGKIGWRVVHKDSDSPKFKTTPEIEKQCRWYEELIKSPNRTRHPGRHQDAFISMLESKMLFDRIPIEKLEHLDYRGSGAPASWLVPDAATIKPTTWVLQAMGGAPGYTGKNQRDQVQRSVHNSQTTAKQLLAYNTEVYAKNMAKKNGTSEAHELYRLNSGLIKWVQEMPDHQISAGYTDNDISVFIGNPSPQVNAWGWSSGSAFERSFAFGEVIFKMTGYNAEIFDSKMPEGIISINDSGRDKRGKQQFHQRMLEEGSDRYNNIMVQFVGDPEKDVKYLKIKDKPTDMQFQQLFILYVKIKCAAYGFDYRLLNLEDGKSGGMGGSGAAEKQMDLQNEMGIVSDTKYIAHCLTLALIDPWSPDFRMEFVYDVSDSEEKLKILKSKLEVSSSVSEIRKSENLEADFWKAAPKEHQEKLKKFSWPLYFPTMTNAQVVQIVLKEMDIEQQDKAMEQEQKMADQEQPEGEEPVKEDKEIADLRSAIGNQEEENEKMGKSWSIDVNHHY
jgi:hypothetical protein